MRWENFRSFADTGWVEVKPITVVIGSNNSGKTSLHAPLLLMKQTVESADPSTALVTAGELVDVGSFEDAVHCHRKEQAIGLSVQWDHALDPDRKQGALGADRPGSVHWKFIGSDGPSTVVLGETTIGDIFGRPLLTRRRMKSGNYSIAKFPEKLSTAKKSPVERAMVQRIRDAQPDGFLFSEDEIEQAGLLARARAQIAGSSGDNSEFYKLPASAALSMYRATVGYTRSAFEAFLNEIYYVGPIRERLRRFYEVSSARPQSVGTRGEDAPQLIYRWRHDLVRMDELDRWLSRFGFNQDLKIVEHGDYAFSLLLKGAKSTPSMGFVDLGFGLSQILPLIVQGLNASAGDMVVAEQPEIHLNPALQATLADLFVQFANDGLWSYIETHSEHLLLRLRRLVAEGVISSDMIALYYVERVGQKSHVRQIPMYSDGSIAPDTWPKEFFGESLRDAVGLAEAQMRLDH